MIKINNHKNNTRDINVITFNNPSRIYIPLINQNDDNVTLLVKKGDLVNIGTTIGKRKGSYRIPIISSVSGTVVGTTDKYYLNGKKVKCLIIESDKYHKNFTKNKKRLNSYSKEEFISTIRDAGIIGAGGSGFPTYLKFNNELNTIIVNMFQNEPYNTADEALVYNNVEYILDMIDSIMDIYHMEKGYIVVNKENNQLIDILNDYLGTYLKIKLVALPDKYPNGWERNLVRKITHRNYQKYPTEIGTIVCNVTTINYIYEALKYHKPCIERIVTISGEGIEPANIKVKVGTLVSDILKSLGDIPEDYTIIANGPMMGTIIPSKELVVTPNLFSITVLPQIKKYKENNCIKCGKCILACPAGLSPCLIARSINNIEELKKLHPERCCECNSCTYICPSRIPLGEIVKKAKEKVEALNETISKN